MATSAIGNGKYKLKGRFGLMFSANGASNSNESNTVEFPLLSFTGTAATRADVLAQVGSTMPIGAIYIGQSATGTTKPNMFVRVALAGAASDFERFVSAATD